MNQVDTQEQKEAPPLCFRCGRGDVWIVDKALFYGDGNEDEEYGEYGVYGLNYFCPSCEYMTMDWNELVVILINLFRPK